MLYSSSYGSLSYNSFGFRKVSPLISKQELSQQINWTTSLSTCSIVQGSVYILNITEMKQYDWSIKA